VATIAGHDGIDEIVAAIEGRFSRGKPSACQESDERHG
jgi:hypothetical protein